MTRKLDLGCGTNKRAGYVGIDFQDHGQEYVRDLNKGLPFDDNSVDEVFCQHVIEHIHDYVFFMNEIWRVLKDRGKVEIISPHKDSINALRDPYHIRLLDEHSMDYFVPNLIQDKPSEVKAKFEIEKCEVKDTRGFGKNIYWILRAVK